jgi:hypothetical protein
VGRVRVVAVLPDLNSNIYSFMIVSSEGAARVILSVATVPHLLNTLGAIATEAAV